MLRETLLKEAPPEKHKDLPVHFCGNVLRFDFESADGQGTTLQK